MKLTVEIGLKKIEGKAQDAEAIREALDEAIEGLSSIWVYDESEYEITSVEVLQKV